MLRGVVFEEQYRCSTESINRIDGSVWHKQSIMDTKSHSRISMYRPLESEDSQLVLFAHAKRCSSMHEAFDSLREVESSKSQQREVQERRMRKMKCQCCAE